MRPGIYLAHKGVGPTSHSLVRELMAELAQAPRKLAVCHGGTLDPFAEGLLLLLVGQATRLFDLLHAVPKTYVANIRWGAETDNGDPSGQVVATGQPDQLSTTQLDDALHPFLGWTDQVPPATSAKKIDGEPAYKKAHRGEQVVLDPVRVFLHQARWLDHDLPRTSSLRIVCGRGYYVRALVRDLGRALGCRAHLQTLHRTQIGPWHDVSPNERVGLFGRDILPWCPARALSVDEALVVSQGRSISKGTIEPPSWKVPDGFPSPDGPIRALRAGALVALLEEEGGTLRPTANFRGGL